MSKYTVTITIHTDAPYEVVDEIRFMMEAQVESLNDGTLQMEDDQEPVDYDYTVFGSVKKEI